MGTNRDREGGLPKLARGARKPTVARERAHKATPLDGWQLRRQEERPG